jgi:hypothetical protein
MRIALSVIVLLSLRLATATADAPTAPATPPPIYTRQNVFGVPFVMDPAEPGARRAVEVQLHVSENGSPWKLQAKSPPESGSIRFRAVRDGEYHFMVRTKDDHGDLLPHGPPHPELIVVVDTDPPVLELVAERGAGGEIHARWRVRDAHLRYDSLRIEYQVGPDGPLTPVAIDLPPVGATTSAREATWLPEAREVPVTIRAEVSDLAGNVAKSQQLVAGLTRNRAANAGGSSPSQGRPEQETISQWPGEKTQGTPLGRGEPPTMAGSFPSRTTSDRTLAGNATRHGAVMEEVTPAESVPYAEALPPPAAAPVLAQPSPDQRQDMPTQPEDVGLPPSGGNAHQSKPRTRRDVEASDGPRLPWPVAMPASTDTLAGSRETSPGSETVPAGLQPHLINTRRIELDYDVESAGSAGVETVEVWGTRDAGQTWTRVASDEDRRSPAVVTVDNDGLFGFRIIVASTDGAHEEPPKPGDAPDVAIGVDTIKPVAQLTGADLGTAAEANVLTIRWQARDAQLGARPVSLFYSIETAGPWSPIAMDLENIGHHAWRPDASTPKQVYLRMEVRDQAGNVQAASTPEPVSLTFGRPKGHIRGIRPSAINVPPAAPSSGATPSAGATPVWQDYVR